MTKDAFRELCDQVLIPKIGELLHHRLFDMSETLDVMSNALQRIDDRLDHLTADIATLCSHEEER